MKATSSSMARASAANRWKPSGALASFPTARTCSCGLKGIEYLNFMGDIYDVESSLRAQRIASLAETFEMRDALNDKILSYSHGMRQKIVLMGALIHEPQVWILDEPMTGLDPQSSFHLKQMMKEHAAKGKTVFLLHTCAGSGRKALWTRSPSSIMARSSTSAHWTICAPAMAIRAWKSSFLEVISHA